MYKAFTSAKKGCDKWHDYEMHVAAFDKEKPIGIPVILDTDAQSKCDKYIHLGMRLAGTQRFGAYGVLYDLIKYPDRQGA